MNAVALARQMGQFVLCHEVMHLRKQDVRRARGRKQTRYMFGPRAGTPGHHDPRLTSYGYPGTPRPSSMHRHPLRSRIYLLGCLQPR